MHKTMSRIVVLLLVVCLALGNVVPALAADDTGSAGAVTPTRYPWNRPHEATDTRRWAYPAGTAIQYTP